MRFFVTGAAGFIGSHLVDHLLHEKHDVIGYDNFSTGIPHFLEQAEKNPHFTLIEADLLDKSTLIKSMANCEFVFHLAANADVRFGTHHPEKDLEQNTIATCHVLEAMRANSIKKIAFSSTGSIYGEAPVIPTTENVAMPIQTSLYGASKLSAENFIQAYCEGFNFQCFIFRFVSILGERYTHGHVFDFYKQLLANPNQLHVLGNGKQRKSYLYIKDCVKAMLHAISKPADKINIFNLGTDEYCEVNDSIKWICEELQLSPEIIYSGGDRGWIGDNPFIFLDCSRIRKLGWQPSLSIREGILHTVRYLRNHPFILETRK